MRVYKWQHPEKGEISFTDKKRYLWLGAVGLPLIPLVCIALFIQTGNQWVVMVPILIGYLLVPLIDFILGTDRTNPPEEIVPQLDADRYYRWVTYFAIPAQFITVIVSVWFVASYPLSIGFYIAFAISLGLYSGVSINVAHELGHKSTKIEQRLARITLSLTGYGHFSSDHNAGHHRDVSTPEDASSARMGESIYRFAMREIPGVIKRGWQVEASRLNRLNENVWGVQNRILQSYFLTLVLQGGLVLAFGWVVLPFLLVHNALAWFQLTSANYIEHYGLLRMKKSNGRYERCKPHHSWNANHIFSNLVLLQLERHSDHHANPARRYQSLRSFDNLPELPSGYFGMYLLAYFPWLWYRVMDKRLLAIPHINGDLSKVNLDPKKAESLIAQYSSSQALA